MSFIRRIIRFFINLFILIWRTILTMKTVRGILALFLSFMLFVGWAYVFIIIGIILLSPALTAIGTTVALFWFGPFTPLIPITVLTAFFIQRYIFRDRTNDEALKEAIKNFKETKFQDEKEAKALNILKIKLTKHRYKNYFVKQAKRGYYEYK